MVLLRLKKTILMIFLYVMMMLTKSFCALAVASSEECVLNDINENELVVHEGGQDFWNQCDRQVMVQTSLKTHEVVHEGVKSLWSVRLSILRKEQIRVSRWIFPLRCYQCDKKNWKEFWFQVSQVRGPWRYKIFWLSVRLWSHIKTKLKTLREASHEGVGILMWWSCRVNK